MTIKRPIARLAVTAALACSASGALAAAVDWTSWTGTQGNSIVNGSLDVGGTSVGVTYSGVAFLFAQVNGDGTNYWLPAAPYIGPEIDNAPPTADIISLSDPGTSVITFSQAVVDPLIALVSWNGASVTFGGGADQQTYNVQYLSAGCGYWGCGGFANTTSNHFDGAGELHGVVRLLGTYTSISFTDTTSENWHGLTVGIGGGVAPVPLPAGVWLLASALGALTWRRRKG